MIYTDPSNQLLSFSVNLDPERHLTSSLNFCKLNTWTAMAWFQKGRTETSVMYKLKRSTTDRPHKRQHRLQIYTLASNVVVIAAAIVVRVQIRNSKKSVLKLKLCFYTDMKLLTTAVRSAGMYVTLCSVQYLLATHNMFSLALCEMLTMMTTVTMMMTKEFVAACLFWLFTGVLWISRADLSMI
ncbi:hypothetical protein GQX74_011730 [Glossina fuscipes]|nr:hypothetical protein GQX74_011730 [Glossina fuscipes]